MRRTNDHFCGRFVKNGKFDFAGFKNEFDRNPRVVKRCLIEEGSIATYPSVIELVYPLMSTKEKAVGEVIPDVLYTDNPLLFWANLGCLSKMEKYVGLYTIPNGHPLYDIVSIMRCCRDHRVIKRFEGVVGNVLCVYNYDWGKVWPKIRHIYAGCVDVCYMGDDYPPRVNGC